MFLKATWTSEPLPRQEIGESRLDLLGKFWNLVDQGWLRHQWEMWPTGLGRRLVEHGGSLDGSGEMAQKLADFRMEAAPRWDGERSEEQCREYARTLKLWLIEAKERLPGNLIGKRILDSIPYAITIIEEAHEYLKVAKLEQAFNAAIFGGRRKACQSLTGFLASKRAAFAELKKQGLDLLDSEAGQHLRGHLVLRQGGFSQDERQRIRVLTDGSINFKLVEAAIRKIFNDTLDVVPEYKGKGSYWNEEDGDEDAGDWCKGHVYYQDEGYNDGEATIFEDLMEMDDSGEVYMCLEEMLPPMLDETEAIQYAGGLVSYVYAETAERWMSKGKGKGKRPKGKGKGKGHGMNKGTNGFGVYGTYADHCKALQDVLARPQEQEKVPPVPSDGTLEPSGSHSVSESTAAQKRKGPHHFIIPAGSADGACPEVLGLGDGELGRTRHRRRSPSLGGSALVDTAAQHGLIGEQTLQQHDLYLQQHYRLRVQITGEKVEPCVVCAGWGVAGPGGAGKHAMSFARVFADADWSDMANLLLFHTSVNTFQYMKRTVPDLPRESRACCAERISTACDLFEQTIRQTQLRGLRRFALQRAALERKARLIQQQEQLLLAAAKEQATRPPGRRLVAEERSSASTRGACGPQQKFDTSVGADHVLAQECQARRQQRLVLDEV
ncbi:iscS [Symbiodinium sp. CCMP2592]|nr:iscS [Symbiodinium sp. CCMP2592]